MAVNVAPLASAFTEDGGILNYFASLVGDSVIKEFTAGEALEVGESVQLDFTTIAAAITAVPKTEAEAKALSTAMNTVLKYTGVTAGGKGWLGVVMETVASGDKVRVCVKGFCPFAQTAGSVAAGDNLVPGAGDGELITYAAGTHTAMSVVAYALDADSDIGSNPDEIGCAIYIR